MKNHAFQKRILTLCVFLFLLPNAFLATGCRILKKDKQSVAEKKKAEADKKAYEEYEKASKQHYDIQTKETKKMMKKTKKKGCPLQQTNAPQGLE